MPLTWARPRVVLVRTTLPTRAAAQRLARRLIDGRLAACVHLTPLASTYRWQGRTLQEGEVVVEARTARRLRARVRAAMLEGHPYEVPLVEWWPVAGLPPAYQAWLQGETAPPATPSRRRTTAAPQDI